MPSTANVRLRALLPGGLREWTGAQTIADVFARWFGDTEDFELVEATVGDVGDRLHLHWRLRLQAERLGTGWFTVEQQAYADADDGGRIAAARPALHGLPTRARRWLTPWPPGAAGSRRSATTRSVTSPSSHPVSSAAGPPR